MIRPSRVELVAASPAHVGFIANRMRDADRIECGALGRSPKQALRLGLMASSLALTAKVDGRPEAMMGLVVDSALTGEGTPWMLGTDAIYRHGREMIRLGPRILGAMLDSTPRLSNIVGSFNIAAIRLLRRWGFEVREEVIILTAGGVDFLPFSLER